MSRPLDASRTRPAEGGPSFPLANRVERAAFKVAWALLARWNPPPLLKGWRRTLLRLFGARIAGDCVIHPSVRVWLPRNLAMERGCTLGPGVECYAMDRITLRAGALVSQRAHLCAGNHDHRDPDFQLITAPIEIGAKAWIAAEAFVGPGVSVGEGAVLAARAVAARDLAAWTIYIGNPAREAGRRELRGPGENAA